MITKAQQCQKGMSLIELMIAITLGIFITAALVSLFVNSKQNYRLNENMSRLQENARFAVSFIARDLRMADYHKCTSAGHLDDAIAGVNNTGTYTSDTLTVKWQTNECGAASATDTYEYSIRNGSSGNPALFRSTDGASAQELVEGIENLQILYGQDTDNDEVPNYYVDSASVTDLAQVISVRLTLVARTLETNLAAGGGRITRNFTETITLRNRLP